MSKGKAGELLTLQETEGSKPVQELLVDLITNTVRSGAGMSISILQLFRALEREGLEPVLPLIEWATQAPSKMKPGGDATMAEAKPVLGELGVKPGTCKIIGLAVLRGFGVDFQPKIQWSFVYRSKQPTSWE